MILETVQILVAFAAVVASERFMLLHTKGTRVRIQSFRIDDGKRAVFISCEFLRIVAVLKKSRLATQATCGDANDGTHGFVIL